MYLVTRSASTRAAMQSVSSMSCISGSSAALRQREAASRLRTFRLSSSSIVSCVGPNRLFSSAITGFLTERAIVWFGFAWVFYVEVVEELW